MTQRRDARLDAWLGFGGMHPDENTRARHWADRFEMPMMVVALWMFVEWRSLTHLHEPTVSLVDWLLWAFFVLETSILAHLATDKSRYLARNWGNVLIIVAGFPVWFELTQQVALLRGLRLVMLAGYLVHHVQVVRQVLHRHHLGMTLVTAASLITLSGVVMSMIDPAFKSVSDGVWWAWVSATTVGYGDIVPTSTEGRVFAGLLILGGIVLISLITANISAYYFSQETAKETRLEQESLRRIHQLEQHIQRLERKIDDLIDRQSRTED